MEAEKFHCDTGLRGSWTCRGFAGGGSTVRNELTTASPVQNLSTALSSAMAHIPHSDGLQQFRSVTKTTCANTDGGRCHVFSHSFPTLSIGSSATPASALPTSCIKPAVYSAPAIALGHAARVSNSLLAGGTADVSCVIAATDGSCQRGSIVLPDAEKLSQDQPPSGAGLTKLQQTSLPTNASSSEELEVRSQSVIQATSGNPAHDYTLTSGNPLLATTLASGNLALAPSLSSGNIALAPTLTSGNPVSAPSPMSGNHVLASPLTSGNSVLAPSLTSDNPVSTPSLTSGNPVLALTLPAFDPSLMSGDPLLGPTMLSSECLPSGSSGTSGEPVHIQSTVSTTDAHMCPAMLWGIPHDLRHEKTRLKKYHVKAAQLRQAADSKRKMLGAMCTKRSLVLSDVVTITQLVQHSRQLLDSQRQANKALLRHIEHLTALERGDYCDNHTTPLCCPSTVTVSPGSTDSK